MHFCEICKNMFYIKLSGEDQEQIEYYCKKCGNVNTSLLKSDSSIFKERINNNSQINCSNTNKYTTLDNTLPRSNTIKCPNNECESNNPDFDINLREIIYIRNDHTNLKYSYLCSHCLCNWNINR